MQTIRQVFGFFLLLLSTAWWLSDPTDAASLTHVFAWRAVLLQYTGVLAIGVMALALVLAVRPVVFEPWLGGLDKMYRLHKWLGITALGASLAHWLLAVVPSHWWAWAGSGARRSPPACCAPTCPRSNGCSRHCAASAAWPWWWASGRSTWPC
jgi:predicted ferric reductase